MEGTTSAFTTMMMGYDRQIKELQSLSLIFAQIKSHTHLAETVDVRIPEGEALQTIRALSSRIGAIEAHMHDLALAIEKDRPLIEKAQELKDLISRQELRVASLVSTMPTAVVENAKRKASLNASNGPRPSDFDRRVSVLTEATAIPREARLSSIAERDEEAPAKKAKKDSNSLPQVDDAEFKKVPQYMRGRMALHKINASVDEINQFIESKYAMLNAPPNKLDPVAQRKLKEIKKYDIPDNRGFVHFTEFDLKEFKTMDNTTAKIILPVLRHIGYLREMKTTGKDGWKYWVLASEN